MHCGRIGQQEDGAFSRLLSTQIRRDVNEYAKTVTTKCEHLQAAPALVSDALISYTFN